MPATVTYQKALELLRNGLASQGYIAALETKANYSRVWARDGVITGLSALLTGEEQLIEGLKTTLLTLHRYQHELGMIPSNVAFDENGNMSAVSYGSLSGKVDTALWYVLGILIYTRKTGDVTLWSYLEDSVYKVFQLLKYWEYNGKGLLYVPLGGNWADEFILQGYNLTEQLLYLWALKEVSKYKTEYAHQAEKLEEMIQVNYWPKEKNQDLAYHQTGFKHQVNKGKTKFWLAGFNPAGYFDFFDGFAHALTLLLNLNSDFQKSEIERELNNIIESQSLAPCFWPPVSTKDPQWNTLQNNWMYEFRNESGSYQNGGIWPVFNGMLISGLYRSGITNTAEKMRENLNAAVSLPDESYGFYEYIDAFDGKPGGARHQLWSAAGVIFAENSAQNNFIV